MVRGLPELFSAAVEAQQLEADLAVGFTGLGVEGLGFRCQGLGFRGFRFKGLGV